MPPEILELVEHTPRRFPRGAISEEDAAVLATSFKSQVELTPPTFLNGHQWILCAQGFVGYLPVSERLAIALQPKVPLKNLFRMFDLAYQIDVRFFDGTMEVASLRDFYQELARVLANRVLDRSRRGLHREYVNEDDELPFVRGSIDLARHLREPWRVRFACGFQEHTADVPDNQILGWTLSRIARSGLCEHRTAPRVRRAFHAVQNAALPRPFKGEDCSGRSYQRLNEDYRALHGLCRFFLDHTGPSHTRGDHTMVPFLLNMNVLFERFVAEWLKAHLPPEIELSFQETLRLGDSEDLQFRIDMVLKERATGRALMLLDAKYKKATRCDLGDVEQVVAYATALGCSRACLVYPHSEMTMGRINVGNVEVEALCFPLGEELDQAGEAMMARALRGISL